MAAGSATTPRRGQTANVASICVYCASSTGNDPALAGAAEALGREVAGAGHRLVYGGGDVGLMGVLADAALAAGGEVIGVMTEQLVALEKAHGGLTSLEVEATMHARKARMADLADGVVVAPGGFGTWEEAIEILTWNQLGLVSMPVVFLDHDGFYRPLFELMDGARRLGLLSDHNRALALRAENVAEAVELAAGPAAGYEPKWVG